jgi:UDPglucose--hexose-1-phosphate uridylyltransferase
VLSYRHNGGRLYARLVRVVPNRFPALQVEGTLDREGGLFDRMNGIGAHEVIIETRLKTLSTMTEPEIEGAGAYRERVLDERDIRFRYILVFKNQGAPAARRWSTRTRSSSRCRSSPTTSRTRSKGAQHFASKERCVFAISCGRNSSRPAHHP